MKAASHGAMPETVFYGVRMAIERSADGRADYVVTVESGGRVIVTSIGGQRDQALEAALREVRRLAGGRPCEFGYDASVFRDG